MCFPFVALSLHDPLDSSVSPKLLSAGTPLTCYWPNPTAALLFSSLLLISAALDAAPGTTRLTLKLPTGPVTPQSLEFLPPS